MPAFVLFGRDHLLALGAIAAVTAGLVATVRTFPRSAAPVRIGLAATMLTLTALSLIWLRREGVPWASLAPLHLCDAAIFLAAWALLTSRPLACELVYFWAASGTVLAVITPDLALGLPAPEFLMYFGLHGAVIAAALVIPFGLGHRPRRGAVGRALLWTNVYAAFVAGVDLVTGANFMYLRAKPAGPSPLDAFGPWPWYLLVAEVVALVLFWLLALPFRRSAR